MSKEESDSGRVAASDLRQAVLSRYLASHGRQGEERLGRFVGCLLGGAVGDACGAPVEFMSRAEILELHGARGLRTYVEAYGRRGAITDDTQMTLFTAKGLLRAWVRRTLRGIGPVFAAVTDRAYGRWMLTQGERAGFDAEPSKLLNGWLIREPELHARRAPGNTCLAALRGKATAGEPATNTSKGCGGVMRVAPVGLLCLALGPGQDAKDRDDVTFALGREIAGLTHGHPSGKAPAGYLAVVIAALADGASWAAAHERGRRPLAAAPPCGETLTMLDEAVRLAASRPQDPAAVRHLGQGWVAEEALAISVYCAASALGQPDADDAKFENALALAVNHDGDSDLTGAITGNIVGAALGQDCIGEKWLGDLEMREGIREVAQDLATLSVWRIAEQEAREEFDYWVSRYPGG
ncbi:MAG: ADP-ribosylglycohydrolase family protein [Methylibium sp.]|uniref:ADP-ribosylglycohydrolase family protein n=1 Tax=Methylibium sp. TaxID=2067992 RepID=UPI0017F5E445|nr:ADP-ribosylglycohydrolase family protein [Methylibium sp.]MBA3597844.1 ADP-ribosylglycohydrolase family protein [Methylibium sp.]